ncbi:MAG TPA: type II toxin-antitoxin system Y4mF family antitoxin [Gammaproteobacteria bacterium]|nr:type II toxin-antitoxin system Y4mF family antitoxin [Gammaproteobacteria bacterium]
MNQQIFNMEDLARQVLEARKTQGLTQEELAGLSGTGRRFIVDLESGKQTVQMGKVIKVLAALGVALIVVTQWK